MKQKITIFSLLMFGFGLSSNSQNIGTFSPEAKKNADIVFTADEESNLRATGDTIWYESFANGITNWSLSGTPAWKHTSKGSSGQYSTTAGPIKNTTTSDGWVILDVDSFSGVNGYNDVTSSLTSGTINLTGHNDVILSFKHFYRFCCKSTTSLTASVSNDGGSTWTDFDVKGNINTNVTSSNPATKSINISLVAGNQSNVKIKFTFANGSAYFWQIDDILISEAPINDVQLNKSYADFTYLDGGYYTKLPLDQSADFTFRGAVFNNGSANQTGVKLDVDILNGTTSVYNGTSNTLGSFGRATHDTLFVTDAFAPSSLGTYTVNFTASQNSTDEFPTDNVISKSFSVTDSVYARDNGITNATTLSPSNYTNGDKDGSALGNIFDINTETYATSITAFLHSTTTIGTSIKGVIYELTDTDIFEVLTTDFYDITTSSKKNKWVTLPIVDPESYMLTTGSSYLVAFETWGVSATSNVTFASDRVTEQPTGVTFVRTDGEGGSWGWISSGTPLMRLNVNTSMPVGIKTISNNHLKLGQNNPNPASKQTVINYELPNSSKVSLKVFDVTGKEVMSFVEGIKTAGNHKVSLNTSELSSGVYYYTLYTSQSNLTKKMIVTE